MAEVILRNLIISKDGTKISRNGDLLRVVPEEGEGLLFSPKTLRQVIVTCEASVTTGAMKLLYIHGVDFVIVSHRPDNIFLRMVSNDANIITDIWLAQIKMPLSEKLSLASEILSASMDNKIALLKYLARNRGISVDTADMEQMKTAFARATDDMELMGYEGEGARLYFRTVGRLMPKEFGFHGRTKHPPLDPLNAMLSYGYTVLASRVEHALMTTGLNPHVGVLHRPYRNRKSLTYDLIEVFRQPVVDRIVFTLAGKRQIKPEDFKMEKDMCLMDVGAKRALLDAVYSTLESEVNYRGSVVTMMDVIELQAQELKDAILYKKDYRAYRWRI